MLRRSLAALTVSLAAVSAAPVIQRDVTVTDWTTVDTVTVPCTTYSSDAGLSSASSSIPPSSDGTSYVSTTEFPSVTSGGIAPGTSGTYLSSLETSGRQASGPVLSQQTPTSSVTPSELTRPATVSSYAPLASGIDPFAPIATDAPPSIIPATGGHPQPTNNIISQGAPIHTNKFYANMFLGSQMNGIFTTPYVLSWGNGSGMTSSYGMAIAHSEANQRALGDVNVKIPLQPVQFYLNPLGIQSIVLSANELQQGTRLSAANSDTFSADAILTPASGNGNLTFPLVEGMGFVTGVYSNLQPQVQSGVFFAEINAVGAIAPGIYKWNIALNDGRSWLMYVTPDNDSGSVPNFSLTSMSLIQGPSGFSGLIQIAKNPAGAFGESVYDKAAGIYATSAKLSGSVDGELGSYSLNWQSAGKQNGQSLVHYALPHMVDSFDSETSAKVANGMKLLSTTKGNATVVIGNRWTMVEKLPTDMGFAPWSPTNGSVATLSSTAVNAIYSAAQIELQQDMVAQSNLSSMYYSGKALSKFASIVYAVNNLCNEPGLAQQGLASLKTAFAIFTSNKQEFPLYYDTVWKGIVSSASYLTGDSGADFGNTFYNDHHFHYGYFLHAAAIVGSLDSSWLDANKDWVNALARDVSNPSAADTHFPVFRSFDWFTGHSWAKGLFESGDGKDEESSSEDVMFSYGLKMWGHVAGDASMEARGNLMLAVQARSLNAYFLMKADNPNQPPSFVPNKVTGILFENKADHVTYFGANFEYVQGIHMIPLTAASALTRSAQFVAEEWAAYFTSGAVADASNVQGGWKGILYANLALIDPKASFDLFASSGFDSSWLDGGASRTWYLAFAAGMGGA